MFLPMYSRTKLNWTSATMASSKQRESHHVCYIGIVLWNWKEGTPETPNASTSRL